MPDGTATRLLIAPGTVTAQAFVRRGAGGVYSIKTETTDGG